LQLKADFNSGGVVKGEGKGRGEPPPLANSWIRPWTSSGGLARLYRDSLRELTAAPEIPDVDFRGGVGQKKLREKGISQ